ncbi:MAG: CHAT domain-containing protein [Cyanobacteria bacterium J06634_5]
MRLSQFTHQGMRAAVIQEFEISITAVGGDQYLIRTENVAKGVQLAEEKVRWPVDQWLDQAKSLMHDPLLGLLQGQPRHTIPTSAVRSGARSTSEASATPTLVHLGQALHDELFKGQLHDSWVTAQGVAQNRQDLLRLRIGMKENRLQQLPWEALHAGTRPLATGTDVIFSRYILDRRQGHSVPPTKVGSGQVLRILMVIASPDDQERLELKQEVYHLQSELHPDSADQDDLLLDVQLKILEQPGRAELTQELERGNYQVLHYAGHSNLGNAGGDLYLVSRQTGLTERLSGEDLAGLLVNNGIKLAVFNSCRGGYSSGTEQGWQERNLAQALVNRGVPGVIAMTERIPDHVAITFTQLLYRNLKKGQSIDLSLNRTRQGLISAYGSHQFYWALPTLYMQPSFDGYLVKTLLSRENTDALDAGNDPFGDIFFEPGLANVDLPSRPQDPAADYATLRSKSQRLSDQVPTAEGPNEADETSLNPSPDVTDTESVNYRDLGNNNDVDTADTVVKQLSTPLSPAEVDGELRVPKELETSSGFYGEPTPAVPEPPTLDKPVSSSAAKTVADTPAQASAKTPSKTSDEVSMAEPPAEATTKAAPKKDDMPEMVGERLSRSHTLSTKLLTAPAIALAALVAVLGITTVSWLRRPPAAPPAPPESLSEMGLPTQIELAFEQNNLDLAVSATEQLINQGKFSEAITALGTAKPRQQEDVIVLFLRGSAQWGLAKQSGSDFNPDDAMRSWVGALESESDWMEIAMALGFAQYASGREDLALESWRKAVKLAERQPEAKGIFSDKSASDYSLNAQAGVAMAALKLSSVDTDPAERGRLRDEASEAYRKVINEAPADFSANQLGNNWLWLEDAISDWGETKEELSQNIK